MNICAYARFSSSNQREESIEAQLRAIEEYCKHNNHNLVKIYADHAKSATTDKRPEFQKMIQDAEKKLFEGVLVHKLDRFSRDKYDSVHYKRKLKCLGIRVISVLEHLDDSPESLMMESMLEGMSMYYSRNLAREVMKGMKNNALKCMHTGGKPPLGYRIDPQTKKYMVDDEEAEVVRTVFRMYLEDKGYHQIIKYLNDNGHRTKWKRMFANNAIFTILRNQKYMGVYTFNVSASKNPMGTRNSYIKKSEDEIIRIEDGLPAIISKEDFLTVQEKLSHNKKRAGKFKAKETYILSGLVHCALCGSPMWGNSRTAGRGKSKYVSYRCCNHAKSDKGCQNKEINAHYLHEFVLDQLRRNLFNDKKIPHLVRRLNAYQKNKTGNQNHDIDDLRKELSRITPQITNILDAIGQGMEYGSLKDRLSSLEEAKAIAEVKLQEMEFERDRPVIDETTLRAVIEKYRDYLTAKDLPQVKRFIQHYVDRVVVHDDRVELTMKIRLGRMNTAEVVQVGTVKAENGLQFYRHQKNEVAA
ncbi:MAG: recombinase family protein [Candidatus Riflebacteria bacterium]|nr:recombinase family protein [Candidatus Riflebacteria bacterium]